MQFKRRTIALLFLSGLMLGTTSVLLSKGSSFYRERKLFSAKERYRGAYQSPVVVDTNVLESKRSFVNEVGIAVARYPKTFYKDINKDIEKFIDEQFEIFGDSVEVGELQTEGRDTFFITHASSAIPGYAVSFLFELSTSYAGAAHSIDDVVSRSYDLAESRLIMLEDIFYDVSFALQEVSKKVAVDLVLRPELATEEEAVLRGVAPIYDNYKNFILGPDSITFYFSPYQMGPYSIGVVSSEIPYMSIDNLLQRSFVSKVKL